MSSKILFVGSLAVLSTLLASPSKAQSCPASTGPDVIVGDVTGPANYTAVGSIDALSLGTTSCNIGTSNVSWQANNNLHPAIGGTFYRYSVVNGAGRFEQLGNSWLKHGFTALTQNLCCTCSGQGGSVLGVGCSDPYTATRNGSQTGLGPRYQVNAHTGVFNYPPAGGTGGSGSVYRRLEVNTADLTTGNGERYFSEACYVTQDDATAGNQNNNTSWRETSVSGVATDRTFAFVGATHRMQSAIEAWPSIEAGAQVVPIQITGDGLFKIGWKVTAIAGGLYHYEYAVYNQNADRNGGSFTVPMSNSVNVTNIEFHDISYHDGDGIGNVNFSGLDWTASRSASDLTWSCETQAQNASANAIRWSSCYNFRFDADAAPTSGTATVGLWKPGSPANFTATIDVPGNGGPSPAFAYCFGDGSGTACPCGNNSAVGSGEGCLSSIGSGGQLSSQGTPSISADSILLTGSGMTDSSCLYFQGTSQIGAGQGAAFGDGLRCVGGTTIRLAQKTNVLGTSQFPVGGDPMVSTAGQVTSPGVREYQVWYRNADPNFCTVATYNLTNGFQLTWSP